MIKLKEYGKYVVGVGLRESSSDLLVMNCDEYFSYNALAGLVRSDEEEQGGTRRDPWELVSEAIARMQRNGDVMRADRLKQVMQDIDSSFDEKNLGMSKFSRFVQEAAHRGLVVLTKMDNGQLEVAPPAGGVAAAAAGAPAHDAAQGHAHTPHAPAARHAGAPAAEGRSEDRPRRSRRGGRGRGRDRAGRDAHSPVVGHVGTDTPVLDAVGATDGTDAVAEATVHTDSHTTVVHHAHSAHPAEPAIGVSGERLTREEAFDLVRRAVASLVGGDGAVRASDVRAKAADLLGRDSDSLSERNFSRILRDAHDADVIDVRRRGDDYDVALATSAAPVADQLNVAAGARAGANGPAPAAAPACGTSAGLVRGARDGVRLGAEAGCCLRSCCRSAWWIRRVARRRLWLRSQLLPWTNRWARFGRRRNGHVRVPSVLLRPRPLGVRHPRRRRRSARGAVHQAPAHRPRRARTDDRQGGARAHRPARGHGGVVANAARRRPLPRSFYERDSVIVARALLGAVLECETPEGRASGRIVETEAYLGPADPASHAVAGLTARTQHLFGRPGSAYVYFIYGMHWCVNAVAGQRGAGTAVLIRALEPVDGIALMRARRWQRGQGRRKGVVAAEAGGVARRDRDLANGPGKLCAALGIDARLNGVTLLRPPLTIRAGHDIPDALVGVSPRIGITRAADLPGRFFVRDSQYVSRTPSHFVTRPFKPGQ